MDGPTSAVYLPALVHDIVVNGEARSITPGTTVAALLDTLGIERAHVLGNSAGGSVSARFALDHPERVDRLVLMGPGGVGTPIFAPSPSEGIKRLVEFIGAMVQNDGMVNLGIVISLLVPSDAIWKAASFYAQSPLFLAIGGARGQIPFIGAAPPTASLVAWALAYPVVFLLLAVRSFSRRDL